MMPGELLQGRRRAEGGGDAALIIEAEDEGEDGRLEGNTSSIMAECHSVVIEVHMRLSLAEQRRILASPPCVEAKHELQWHATPS